MVENKGGKTGKRSLWLKPHDVLFHENDHAESLFIIKSGIEHKDAIVTTSLTYHDIGERIKLLSDLINKMLINIKHHDIETNGGILTFNMEQIHEWIHGKKWIWN